MRKTLITIAVTAILMPASAWADDAAILAYIHEERPAACKEATARIVAATGGHFHAGERVDPVDPSTHLQDDTVDVAGNEVMIDCGVSPETISVTMDTDVKYPPNEWFAAASKVAHGLTGDPIGKLQKVLRKCFLDSVKGPRGLIEADLPKTHFVCDTTPLTTRMTIMLQARYSAK